MTDQDWDVDGGAGGAADGGGDSSASRPAPGDGRSDAEAPDARSAKVVPFPGNWFGAIEDLVPIHPEPVPLRPERARASVETAPPPAVELTPPVEPAATSAADASDFWEGDAATLQEVPADTDRASSIALLRSPAATSRRSWVGKPADDADQVQSGDEPETESGGPSRQSSGRGVPVRAIAALLVTAVIGAGVVVMQLIPGSAKLGAPRHPGRLAAATEHRPRVVTATITSPVVTVTTRATPRTRHHRAARGSAKTQGTETGSAVNAATSNEAGGAGGSTTSNTEAASPAEPSSHPTTPPPSSAHPSAGSAGSGSGCVQSPDSGCLP